jgi:thymidylate synthase (FAD)
MPEFFDPYMQANLLDGLTPNQLAWAHLHQDYCHEYIIDVIERGDMPTDAVCGKIIVDNLLEGKKHHWGPLENGIIEVAFGHIPHSVMQQLRTHRVGVSFDCQCLAGDTNITFVNTNGVTNPKLRKKIKDLYELWENGEKAVRDRKVRGRNNEPPGQYRRDTKTRIKKMNLRVLNEETNCFEVGHIKDILCSGEKPVYRITLSDGKTLDCTKEHRLYTSQGWQAMGKALGLITNSDNIVLAVTKNCTVMVNGVVRTDALYTQETWLSYHAAKGLNANDIADLAGCSSNVIHNWAKHYEISLKRGYAKGVKAVVGNGIYRNKKWLLDQITKGLTIDVMASIAGCSEETIKKWCYKYAIHINKRAPGTQKPWNKGLCGDYSLNLTNDAREARSKMSSKNVKKGKDSHFWKGGTSEERELISAWTRNIAPKVHRRFNYTCQMCGMPDKFLHAHHLIPVYADPSLAYHFDNLVTLCKDCHEWVHHTNTELDFAKDFKPDLTFTNWPKKQKKPKKLRSHPVDVVSVEYIGVQTTYDIEVDGPWHNFVANGLVVHNSFRYTSQGLINAYNLCNELASLQPLHKVFYFRPIGHYGDREAAKYDYTQNWLEEDLQLAYDALGLYVKKLKAGFAPEHARGMLPFDYRQHFVVSFNLRSLMHMLDLRWKKNAQLEAQKTCDLLWEATRNVYPEVSDWYEKNRAKKAILAP